MFLPLAQIEMPYVPNTPEMTRASDLKIKQIGIRRLMTHDERQAKAAVEAGFEVVRPGSD